MHLLTRGFWCARAVGALLLVLVTLASFTGSAAAQAQPSEAQIYAAKIQADPGAANGGHLAIYSELVRKGKKPYDAYRAAYIYNKGFEIGYYYGVVDFVLKGQRPADNYDTFFSWQTFYQQQAWSKPLWGWFQQGYLDGHTKGKRVAARLEAGRSDLIPPANVGDLNRYQRSLNIDPDDPWSDLRVREQITGPK
jgi:hypothetical protein